MGFAENTGEEVALVEASFRHRMSWSAAFAGAVIGTAVIFFLLMLGSGIGLSLMSPGRSTTAGFLSLGAIYFLAAQAMGFAVGGHIVGRLIGPMAETDREEEFRAAAHGLTVWGLCVTATALLMLISGWVAAGSSVVASNMALASPGSNSAVSPPNTTAYWTDVLFRPAQTPMHAEFGWKRFAQADNSATDATAPSDDETQSLGNSAEPTQMTPVPPGAGKVENDQRSPSTTTQSGEDPTAPHVITIPSESDLDSNATPATTPGTRTRDVSAADKAEVGRILQVSVMDGGSLSPYDRDRVVQLVSQDAGIDTAEAARRVVNAQSQIRRDRTEAAETLRKAARNASLWIAFALLFGAAVAAMAAISARWEDDRITFGWRRAEAA